PGPAFSIESEASPESVHDGAEDGLAHRTSEPQEELPRPGFSRMHVGVIGVLLVLGLVAAGWLLPRARPVAVASPGEVVTMSTPLQNAPAASPSTSERATRLVVPVLGAGRGPGAVSVP